MLGLQDLNVMILIAPERFRDEEYSQTHAALTGAKANVTVVSSQKAPCTGMRGSIVHAQMALDDAVKQKWDCLAIIGGDGVGVYLDDPRVAKIARQVVDDGKVLAAICMAPVVLAHAGLLDGVDATVFPDPAYQQDLRDHGANLQSDAVVEGKNNVNGAPLITANGPKAAFAFGLTLTGVLRGPVHDPWS